MVQPGAAAPAAVTGTIAGVNDHQPSRAQQLLRAIRKEIPEALADEQDHDDAEVATMLRALGIALGECEQPTQLVAARPPRLPGRYVALPASPRLRERLVIPGQRLRRRTPRRRGVRRGRDWAGTAPWSQPGSREDSRRYIAPRNVRADHQTCCAPDPHSEIAEMRQARAEPEPRPGRPTPCPYEVLGNAHTRCSTSATLRM